MKTTRTPRIVIEDLPVLEQLTEEEMASIYGAGKKGVRLGLEQLETRELMAAHITANLLSDGTLRVEGTENADKIYILQSDGASKNVSVGSAAGGAQYGSFSGSLVKRVEVWGLGGNDTINLQGTGTAHHVKVGSFVDGGAGNDSIVGGDAVDQIFGGAGTDSLFGMAGNDFLFGEADYDLLDGGSGSDQINADRLRTDLDRDGQADWLVQFNTEASSFASRYYLDTRSIGGTGEVPLVGDFNGDGLSDIGVYIPDASGARWVVKLNNGNGTFASRYYFDMRNIGGTGELPLVGDFNGDGLADIGVYIPDASGARWVVKLNNGNGTFASRYYFDMRNIGGTGELPLVGDFNGDGLADMGVYIPDSRGARWVVKLNNGNATFASRCYFDTRDIGGTGELPVVADFNDDGLADLGVYIPDAGGARWVVRVNNGNATFASRYYLDTRDIGGTGEVPLVGDFNGDGLADIGIYDPDASGARWVVRRSTGDNAITVTGDGSVWGLSGTSWTRLESALTGSKVFFQNTDGCLYRFDLTAGTITCYNSTPVQSFGTSGSVIYSLTEDNELFRQSFTSTSRTELEFRQIGGKLVFKNTDGLLYSMDPANHAVTSFFGKQVKAFDVTSDGTVFILDTSAKLYKQAVNATASTLFNSTTVKGFGIRGNYIYMLETNGYLLKQASNSTSYKRLSYQQSGDQVYYLDTNNRISTLDLGRNTSTDGINGFAVTGNIAVEWMERGLSTMGVPTNKAYQRLGATVQNFTGGALMDLGSQARTFAVLGQFCTVHNWALGLPRGDAFTTNDNILVQVFDNGVIYRFPGQSATAMDFDHLDPAIMSRVDVHGVYIFRNTLLLLGNNLDNTARVEPQGTALRWSMIWPQEYAGGGYGEEAEAGILLNGMSKIKEIRFFGLDGNDTFENLTSIPALAFGGEGDDTLMGYAGQDVLDGGQGSDQLQIHFDFGRFLQSHGASVVNLSEYTTGAAGSDTFVVKLDLGTFGTQILQPFLTQAKQATSQLQPLIDLLNREIPFVSQFVSGLTFGSVLAKKSPKVMEFIQAIDALNHFNPSKQLGGSVIELGSFEVSSLQNIVPSLAALQLGGLGFSAALDSLNKAGLRFDVFQDTRSLVRMMMGDDSVNLMTYQIPTFEMSFSETIWEGSMPTPVGPVGGRVLGLLGMKAGGMLGYDMAGIRSGHAVDGFFASGVFFEFHVGLGAEGFYGLAHVIEVGIGGTITAGLQFQLTDNNDGKLRLNEFSSAMQVAPSVVISWEVYAYVTTIFQVEVEDWTNPLEVLVNIVDQEKKETLTLAKDSFTIDL